MTISEFNDRFDTELDDTDYTTVGGYLFGLLGRLPKVGDRTQVGALQFEITEMDGRRVGTIKVEVPPAAES